jgi:thiol:disulfide interchange protein DsbD
MYRLFFCCVAPLALVTRILGQLELPGGTPATRAEWVCEASVLAPGASFSVALKLAHPAGWHSYYQNSGGIEQSLSIRWHLPEGFSAGPVQWPVPEVKDGFAGKSFVYAGSPVFVVDMTAPATLQAGQSVTLSAEASWQICTAEACNNEAQTLHLVLPVGSAMEQAPAVAGLFAQARARQAERPAGWKFSAEAAGEGILLRVDPGGDSAAGFSDFIPGQSFVLAASAGGSIRREGGIWSIQLPRAMRDALKRPIIQGASVSGILLGPRAIAVPATRIARAAPAPLAFFPYLSVLGGMLLGGLILNLMPCVFPVIGLKILGFVRQAGSDRKKIALHGLVFVLGVLASFAVLSGILFAARAAAGPVGWGYQLQNPWVVLALMVLMFVLALNMFGVFELGSSATSIGGSLQTRQGLAGSFFSGVLATVVATPCSAPFLGVALGIAIALPAVQFFLAFAAMAVGLALPYLILSVFPQLLGFLPRPGAWMESFKQAMSFLLFATAGYLLWVYAGLIDLENLPGPIFGLAAIAVAAWIYGRWNLPHRSGRTRAAALVLTTLFAVAGLYLAKPPPPSVITWETWSPQRVESLLEDGHPVYIDFTAQWCATCQANKLRAYSPQVVALMRQKGVVALKADKTKPNPQIEAALQQLGRSAIPVNVLLAPGREPVILPALLSPKDLLGALDGL